MNAVHLNLDDAWPANTLGMDCLDLRHLGPSLRYITRRRDIEAFRQQVRSDPRPLALYGSGDFHHLTAVLLGRFDQPVTVVCFDNHPDWDMRPPRWGCGGWTRRALELPHVRRISVWGCGNFEPAMPSRIFANHRALRSGRLQIHPWRQRQSGSALRRFSCMTAQDWMDRFEQLASELHGQGVYITVDMDCLNDQEAVTNWENGLFSAEDVAWAIRELRRHGHILGGDVCGARSNPSYARWTQRLAGWWDHPRLPVIDPAESRRVNLASLQKIWPALAAGD